MKRTPGPWLPMAGMPTNILDSSGLRVARCDYDGEMDNPQCDANARLIAAAPDLLEACRNVLRTCEHVEPWDGDDGGVMIEVSLSRRTIHALREAIAKAEGAA